MSANPAADPATPAPAATGTPVTITKAKGRPMLTWVGKRPLTQLTAFPAQHIETCDPAGALAKGDRSAWPDWPAAYPCGGLLFHGDNKEVLAHLLANGFRGKVNLIYIDPPFDSGADYVRKVSLRGPKGAARLAGETYTLGEQIQYTDIWANDNYLQFMYERLMLLKELLAENGAIYVHCDTRKSHHLRCLLDEVLGPDGFVSEIVWQSSDAQSSANRYGPIHNTIFYYARSDHRVWNDVRTPMSRATADAWYNNEEVAAEDITNRLGQLIRKGSMRRFNTSDLTARKPGGDTEYEWRGVRPSPGRYWAYSRANLEQFEAEKRIFYTQAGRPYLKRYLDESEGTPPQDVWTDVSMIRGISKEETSGYPTEKPEGILARVIRVSSNPGDLVLDCFLGSGTTAAVAQKLGRRWIGCDINKGAIQTTSKRLQAIVAAQTVESARPQQGSLAIDSGSETAAAALPAQLGFTVWRVNDYDLQIQHNEAVNLACEHLGVTRTRGDSFFDGTRGKALAKIVPFGHPLTLLDLEELKRELAARPDEGRDVVLVCLGKETPVDAWVADWNRLRRQGEVPNRIEVVELRTDTKYGAFLVHQPAQAQVEVRRDGATLIVEVREFISPSIIERLKQQAGVLSPQIDDWRAMVDCILIDPAYAAARGVFTVALADVPEKKTDLVNGRYELPAPPGPTTVAVKLIDMLGEEVLVTQAV